MTKNMAELSLNVLIFILITLILILFTFFFILNSKVCPISSTHKKIINYFANNLFMDFKIYPPGPNSEGFNLRIFQIPDAEAIILSLQFSLQNKTNDFVFLIFLFYQ